MKEARPHVRPCEVAQNLTCSVSGIVVDEHDLPVEAREYVIQSYKRFPDVFPFVERRHDHGKNSAETTLKSLASELLDGAESEWVDMIWTFDAQRKRLRKILGLESSGQ